MSIFIFNTPFPYPSQNGKYLNHFIPYIPSKPILINQLTTLLALKKFQNDRLACEVFERHSPLPSRINEKPKLEQVASYKPPKQEEQVGQSFSSNLKAQITDMVKFFINEFDNNDQAKIAKQRTIYTSNKPLLELFDRLREKYSIASKCREDMIRLALRKALSFFRDSLRKKLKISAKAASLELCKRYFENTSDDLSQGEGKNQTDILSHLLPYKKNSRHSTPNTSFIREIFASEAFNEDYVEYLSKFDEILEADNQKKIPKLIDFLVDCVQNNTMHKVKTFKRLPWLLAWIQATKIIALELFDANSAKIKQKKNLKGPKGIENLSQRRSPLL